MESEFQQIPLSASKADSTKSASATNTLGDASKDSKSDPKANEQSSEKKDEDKTVETEYV